MPRANGHLAEGLIGMREERQERDESGAHEERLSDCRIANGFGIRACAVLDEVDPTNGGKPLEAGRNFGYVEPRGEEAGGLGTLSRCDDDEHDGNPSLSTVSGALS